MAGEVAECCSTHLIEGNGSFNAEGLDNFVKQVKLGECGVSYVVVAVMGPQSSGKSTLLNHLFHTKFVEMNADMGRTQTTQGIWIARCTGIEPCTIVMDVEGTDGQERGEDDTAFEKQSALFAIAVSDIVLINMWCNEIGRENAANKPLLRTVFKVMLRLFSPRKRTLMFVLRDKTTTPLELLDSDLRSNIRKIWDSVPKPEALKSTDLSNFFNVKVVALPHYVYEREHFNEQVASLRQKFYQSIAPGGLACDRLGVIPASGFSLSSKNIWDTIKDNKDLNLPNHTIMVATVRCEEILCEKYSSFVANTEWLGLAEDVKSRLVPGFGNKLSALLHDCLSSYDEEVIHYDGNVRAAKRKQLIEKLNHLVQPSYTLMLGHIQAKALDIFKTTLEKALNDERGFAMAARDCSRHAMSKFDELCKDATCDVANWDSTKIRDKFSRDLASHITKVRSEIVKELTTLYESNMYQAICGPVQDLLEKGTDNTWPAIRTLLRQETETVVLELSFALSAFEMDAKEMEGITLKLKNYSRRLVEGKAKGEAEKVLFRMKDRFIFMFNHDDDSMPRVSWNENEDIPAIAKNARTSCLKLLSVMAAICLDEDVADTIWDMLVRSLIEQSADTSTVQDPLASTTWEKVPAPNTLITPIQCKALWDQFQRDTELFITQAIVSQQEANNRENNANNTESSSGLDPFSYHVGMAIGHVIGTVTRPVRLGVEAIANVVDAFKE